MAVVMKVARIMGGSLGGDGIVAATAERAASGETAQRQPCPSCGAVLGDGFGGILRTRRAEPARRETAATSCLVEPDDEEEDAGGPAHRSPTPLARCIASVTRFLNSWNETFRTPGSAPMR